jgi:hypothetical protein
VAATGELSSKDHQHTSVLFPYFSGVIGSLLGRAESIPTSDEAVSLQMAAFAAVRDVVTHSPEDCCPMLADLAAVVNRQGADTGRRLQLMGARAMTQQQEAYLRRLRDLQAFLCTVLQVLSPLPEKQRFPSFIPPCRGEAPCHGIVDYVCI